MDDYYSTCYYLTSNFKICAFLDGMLSGDEGVYNLSERPDVQLNDSNDVQCIRDFNLGYQYTIVGSYYAMNNNKYIILPNKKMERTMG